MSSDVFCFEGRIQNADVRRDQCIVNEPGFWGASESMIWVVSVDDTGKVTPHIRPVGGLEAVFHGEICYNMAKRKKERSTPANSGGWGTAATITT